ncbi:OmpA family protein [Kribbella sp. NPDC051620]|uniref:channel-forming protein ArfA/OmpATb n=1 Tax=Kribbella sp. NPDC051620 TaxID=3364120 RepID=UPI00379B974D
MPGLARRRPGFVWLLALVLVPVLLTALVIALGGTEQTAADPTSSPSTGAATVTAEEGPAGTPTAVPSAPPTVAPFELSRTDEAITVHAVVRDQETKDKLVAEVQALLTEGTDFTDQISIDEKTALPNPTALSALLHALSTATGEAAIKYDGDKVTLSGKVADQATKATAARAAAAAVPGAVVANELQIPAVPKPPVSEACQTFEARLARFNAENKLVFLSGTDTLNDASRPSVTKVAKLLLSCAGFDVEVSGHTDNLGNPATSLPLSQQRADAVKTALVKLGVPAGRITSRGYGETRPIASNSTSTGRIANRRVEIRVL